MTVAPLVRSGLSTTRTRDGARDTKSAFVQILSVVLGAGERRASFRDPLQSAMRTCGGAGSSGAMRSPVAGQSFSGGVQQGTDLTLTGRSAPGHLTYAVVA
ncbi:hypothetical protein ACWC0C_09470 [Streptomyces sp. NPDC001709]